MLEFRKVCHSAFRKSVDKMLRRQNAHSKMTNSPFFAIFLTFVVYTTHFRVTFVQNVKQTLKIDPPYCASGVNDTACI
jgi:hypothetical protein